jgi:predicted nuclease of predicted toxin-antitoxin system
VRVLLDENLPRQLARELTGHETSTVRQMGWASLKNGALLAAMVDAGFDALLTMDKNLSKQQRVSNLPFGIVIVRTRDSQLPTLLPLVPTIRRALAAVRPGQVIIAGET